MRSLRRFCGISAVVAALASPSVASALGPDEAIAEATRAITESRNSLNSIQTAMRSAAPLDRSAAQRLADGDLLLRSRDYDRAAIVFSQIVERFAGNQSAYSEALFLLGETYFQSGQYLSARRVFTRVVAEGTSGRLSAFRPRALARLTDIALRTNDLEALDDLYRQMNQIPSSSVEAILTYARGRLLLAKNDLPGARSALQGVPSTSPFHHQSAYLVGVVALREVRAAVAALPEGKNSENTQAKRGAYAKAVEAFRLVTRLPPDTDQHRQVIDLAWLAVGRLLYETDQWVSAIDAYNHVGRESPEFGHALFELASVYVQMGDMYRAQRALEVLAVVDPSGSDAAEASLLRGDLELRSGQFKKALATFDSVRAQFDPMRVSVEEFLGSSTDPAVYYDKLVDEQLDATASTSLPPLAVRWAREEQDGPEAFTVVDEVVQTRRLLQQSQELAAKVDAIMNSPSRVKAFPELRAGQQAALAALNSSMRGRAMLGQGLDSVEPSDLSGEIGSVRQQRRALQAKVLGLPVTAADFQSRDATATRKWNEVAQKVQHLELQVNTLQAIVNALHRVLSDSATRGVVRDPETTRRFEAELQANEKDIAIYKQQIEKLRQSVNYGRVASGHDDTNLFDDDNVREQYKRLLAQEIQLASRGAAGGDAVAYAGRAAGLLVRLDQVEGQVQTALGDVNRRVDAKTTELLTLVATEQAKITEYAARLDLLDQEARLIVGEVAMRNFGLVRDRLRGIVLRADVGVTEEAWEAREEQMVRVRRLQTERARAERLLNEELREVLDDSVDQ